MQTICPNPRCRKALSLPDVPAKGAWLNCPSCKQPLSPALWKGPPDEEERIQLLDVPMITPPSPFQLALKYWYWHLCGVLIFVIGAGRLLSMGSESAAERMAGAIQSSFWVIWLYVLAKICDVGKRRKE